MRKYLITFNGQQALFDFQSESPVERSLLLKMEQRQSLTTSEEVTVKHWVESGLADAGHPRCHLVGIDEGSGHRFLFSAVQEGPGLGR
jgi:hypothetical protein